MAADDLNTIADGLARVRVQQQDRVWDEEGSPDLLGEQVAGVLEQVAADREAEEYAAGDGCAPVDVEDVLTPEELAAEPTVYRAHATKRSFLIEKRRNLVNRLAMCEPDGVRLSTFARATPEQALYHIRRRMDAGSTPDEAAQELVDWLCIPFPCQREAMSFVPRYMACFRDVLLG